MVILLYNSPALSHSELYADDKPCFADSYAHRVPVATPVLSTFQVQPNATMPGHRTVKSSYAKHLHGFATTTKAELNWLSISYCGQQSIQDDPQSSL